jgi:hypothetical protein
MEEPVPNGLAAHPDVEIEQGSDADQVHGSLASIPYFSLVSHHTCSSTSRIITSPDLVNSP